MEQRNTGIDIQSGKSRAHFAIRAQNKTVTPYLTDPKTPLQCNSSIFQKKQRLNEIKEIFIALKPHVLNSLFLMTLNVSKKSKCSAYAEELTEYWNEFRSRLVSMDCSMDGYLICSQPLVPDPDCHAMTFGCADDTCY